MHSSSNRLCFAHPDTPSNNRLSFAPAHSPRSTVRTSFRERPCPSYMNETAAWSGRFRRESPQRRLTRRPPSPRRIIVSDANVRRLTVDDLPSRTVVSSAPGGVRVIRPSCLLTAANRTEYSGTTHVALDGTTNHYPAGSRLAFPIIRSEVHRLPDEALCADPVGTRYNVTYPQEELGTTSHSSVSIHHVDQERSPCEVRVAPSSSPILVGSTCTVTRGAECLRSEFNGAPISHGLPPKDADGRRVTTRDASTVGTHCGSEVDGRRVTTRETVAVGAPYGSEVDGRRVTTRETVAVGAPYGSEVDGRRVTTRQTTNV